jgi:hypothetical protein
VVSVPISLAVMMVSLPAATTFEPLGQKR